MDRKDLKIQALLEKISSLTTNYENQVADLRVEVTVTQQEKNELEQRLSELENEDKVNNVLPEEINPSE